MCRGFVSPTYSSKPVLRSVYSGFFNSNHLAFKSRLRDFHALTKEKHNQNYQEVGTSDIS